MLRSVAQGLSQLHLHSTGAAAARAAALPQLCAPLLHQQARTTFILRRKYPMFLRNGGKRRKMRAKDFVYEMVEDTNVTKQPPMKLILTHHVEGLGSRGDVVEVSRHRGRNELLMQGLAVYASPDNLDKYSGLANKGDRDEPSSQFALKTAGEISTRVISVCMNKDTPWQVEPWHVRVALRKVGIMVPEEALTLPQHPITGPDMAIQNKEFLVKIKINKKEETKVRCRIHHYSSNPRDRVPWQAFHWEYPAEPLFPEEAEELAELTRLNPHTREPQAEETV